MIWLPEGDRADALALEGAAPFDPMGDGRARSDKVMLPERMMADPDELRHWIARAFKAAAKLPAKMTSPQKKAAAKTKLGPKKTMATKMAQKRSVSAQSAKRRRTEPTLKPVLGLCIGHLIATIRRYGRCDPATPRIAGG